MLAARSKLNYLCKQKKLLKRCKQKLFNNSLRYAKDLKLLEALKALGNNVSILEGGLMPSSLALDQSAFTPVNLNSLPKASALSSKTSRGVVSSL